MIITLMLKVSADEKQFSFVPTKIFSNSKIIFSDF